MIDAKKIEEMKAKHPGVQLYRVTLGEDQFVLRAPSPEEWARFEKSRSDDFLTARRRIVSHCVLYPDAGGLEAACDKRPALAIKLFDKCCEYAGLMLEAQDEKL